MKESNRYIFIAFFLAFLFFGGVENAHATAGEAIASAAGSVLGGTFDLVGTILSPLGWLLMKLTSQIAMLGGVALNASIYYTVIQMSEHFGKIPAISETWGVVRDIANMGFIFVLLYASIMSIIGRESPARGLIVKMVIAAVLVNFSLFFTKVVIDISNLLALTFYKALVPAGELASGNFLKAGLSNTMISALKVSSLWDTPGLDGANLFITAILSSIVLLITAFVFFAVAIMFVTRYIVLIFVLILSPIAFVSQILPGLSSLAKQWKDALSGQALFAPVYFLMTWIAIKVITSVSETAFHGAGFGAAFTASGSETFDPSIAGTLVNFAIVIGAIIASLVVAKSTAGKTASGLNKWMTNVAGGATLGMTGRLGRSTIGMAGSMVGDSEFLKRNADKAGPAGAAARLALAAGRKTSKATFDARGSALYEKISETTGVSFGKPIGKGGFAEETKKRAKEQKEYGESLKPTDIKIDEAKQDLERAKLALAKDPTNPDLIKNRDEAQKKLDDLQGVNAEEVKKRKKKNDEERDEKLQKNTDIKEEKRIDDELEKKRKEASETTDDAKRIELNEEIAKLEEEKKIAKTKADKAREIIAAEHKAAEETIKEVKSAGDRRKAEYANTLRDPRWIKNRFNYYVTPKGDKQAAAELRKGGGKKADELIKEALKKTGELKEEEGETKTDEDKKGGETPAGGATSTTT